MTEREWDIYAEVLPDLGGPSLLLYRAFHSPSAKLEVGQWYIIHIFGRDVYVNGTLSEMPVKARNEKTKNRPAYKISIPAGNVVPDFSGEAIPEKPARDFRKRYRKGRGVYS